MRELDERELEAIRLFASGKTADEMAVKPGQKPFGLVTHLADISGVLIDVASGG